MSILAGTIIILIAAFTPSALPIGMFWPISLALILSVLMTANFKCSFGQFAIGLLIGSIIYGVYNFIYAAQLAPLLLAIQVFPILAAFIGFIVGSKIYVHTKNT